MLAGLAVIGALVFASAALHESPAPAPEPNPVGEAPAPEPAPPAPPPAKTPTKATLAPLPKWLGGADAIKTKDAKKSEKPRREPRH